MDIERHIEIWRDGSIRALGCAETLLQNEYIEEGLFWTHLIIEKALKAHVVKSTGAQPPYIHNLIRLAETAELDLSDTQKRLCVELLECHITGRYFEDGIPPVSRESALNMYARTAEFHTWLIKAL